jgi:hypothetical protein
VPFFAVTLNEIFQADAPLDLAKPRHHLEVLADALAAPANT